MSSFQFSGQKSWSHCWLLSFSQTLLSISANLTCSTFTMHPEFKHLSPPLLLTMTKGIIILHLDHCSGLLMALTFLPSLLNMASRVILWKYQSNQLSPCYEPSPSSRPRIKANSLPSFLAILPLISFPITTYLTLLCWLLASSLCQNILCMLCPRAFAPTVASPWTSLPPDCCSTTFLTCFKSYSKFTFPIWFEIQPQLYTSSPFLLCFLLSIYYCVMNHIFNCLLTVSLLECKHHEDGGVQFVSFHCYIS